MDLKLRYLPFIPPISNYLSYTERVCFISIVPLVLKPSLSLNELDLVPYVLLRYELECRKSLSGKVGLPQFFRRKLVENPQI